MSSCVVPRPRTARVERPDVGGPRARDISVDTGVWFETNAGRGELAARLREVIAEHRDALATSVPVLAELWSLLAVRKNAALATATCLDIAAHTDVLGVTTDDHEQALASLDDHFRVYRHGRRCAGAFRVVG